MRGFCLLTFVLGFSGFLSGCSEEVVPIVRFDEVNSAVPLVESTLYNRVLTWRPADRTTVNSNPPRFSWPYEPDIIPEGESSSLPVRKFAFQISEDSDFQKILLDIKATDFNFYNTIPKLPVGKELFWKIGYYPPNRGGPPEWQGVRRFRIEPGTLTWARDRLAIPDLTRDNHPRIIFKKERMNELRALVGRDAFSREIYGKVLADATADLNADWFLKFPASDLVPEKQLREIYSDIPPWLDPDGGDAPYLQMADRLISMAFAYMLSGDERFLEVVERLVTVASWGRTGETRPEGVEGGRSPDNVSLIEYLSLFYDWFYDELSPAQRATVLEGLRWRVEHIVNNYSWRQGVGSKVYPYSISIAGSSHPYENINYTFPAGLAAYEEGGVFKTTYDLAVNFLSGVNNCFGPEDAWNEGPGYGLSKFKWMVNATCYYDMTLENGGFGLNPFLSEIGEFFNRVASRLGYGTNQCHHAVAYGNHGIMHLRRPGKRSTHVIPIPENNRECRALQPPAHSLSRIAIAIAEDGCRKTITTILVLELLIIKFPNGPLFLCHDHDSLSMHISPYWPILATCPLQTIVVAIGSRIIDGPLTASPKQSSPLSYSMVSASASGIKDNCLRTPEGLPIFLFVSTLYSAFVIGKTQDVR